MANTLRKYIPRAPRFELDRSNNYLLRFAREGKHASPELMTEIINVSQSGLAFVTDRPYSPEIGENIKLEFSLEDGGGNIAWFGRVVRIELPEDQALWKTRSQTVRVAVHFHELPAAHRTELHLQLDRLAQKIEKERRTQRRLRRRQWLKAHAVALILLALTFAATIATLVILSRPNPNYDPQNPSIWGERFKF